jgi:hypothetical protein
MHEMPRRTNRAVWSDPCRRFFLLLTLLPISFGAAGWLGFNFSRPGLFVAVVLWFLVVVVVALPWLLSKLLTRGQERQEDVGLLGWLKGYMDIATGRMEARQFAIQVLIAPAAAVIGLILIAVVHALVT